MKIFKYLPTLLLISMTLSIAPFKLAAQVNETPVEYSAFSVYESANTDLIIDKVKTKYGLGVAGIKIGKSNYYNSQISMSLGVGYHPNYTVSSFGTDFSGPVYAKLFEFDMVRLITVPVFGTVNTKLTFSERSYSASKLLGVRNGTSLKTNSQAKFESINLQFGKEVDITNGITLHPFFGIQKWSMWAEGTANSSNYTVNKKVNTSNLDPMVGLKTEFNLFKDNKASLDVIFRQLTADNRVSTLEIKGAIQF